MTGRNFICPITEEQCARDDCARDACVMRQIEDGRFHRSQADAKARRLQARVDPLTGKAYLPGKLEDYDL